MPAAEQFPALVWQGVPYPDVPEHAALFDLRASCALPAAGAAASPVLHELNAPSLYVFRPDRAYMGFDAFGAAERYEGRILGMEGFLTTAASVPPSSLKWASWWLERYGVGEEGVVGALDGYPTHADGHEDGSASGARRDVRWLGVGNPPPLPAPIRGTPKWDPLLRVTDRIALRAWCEHDVGDIVPDLPITSLVTVRVIVALWPINLDPVAP